MYEVIDLTTAELAHKCQSLDAAKAFALAWKLRTAHDCVIQQVRNVWATKTMAEAMAESK